MHIRYMREAYVNLPVLGEHRGTAKGAKGKGRVARISSRVDAHLSFCTAVTIAASVLCWRVWWGMGCEIRAGEGAAAERTRSDFRA